MVVHHLYSETNADRYADSEFHRWMGIHIESFPSDIPAQVDVVVYRNLDIAIVDMNMLHERVAMPF